MFSCFYSMWLFTAMDIKCGAFIRSAGLEIFCFIFKAENIFSFWPHDWPGRARREVNCLFIFTDHKMIRRNRREEKEREQPSNISPPWKTTSTIKWMKDENSLPFESCFSDLELRKNYRSSQSFKNSLWLLYKT